MIIYNVLKKGIRHKNVYPCKETALFQLFMTELGNKYKCKNCYK